MGCVMAVLSRRELMVFASMMCVCVEMPIVELLGLCRYRTGTTTMNLSVVDLRSLQF